MSLQKLYLRLIEMGIAEAQADEIIAMVRVFGLDCAETYKHISVTEMDYRKQLAQEELDKYAQ